MSTCRGDDGPPVGPAGTNDALDALTARSALWSLAFADVTAALPAVVRPEAAACCFTQCAALLAAATLLFGERRHAEVVSMAPGVVDEFEQGLDGRRAFTFPTDGARRTFELPPERVLADASTRPVESAARAGQRAGAFVREPREFSEPRPAARDVLNGADVVHTALAPVPR